MTDQIIWWQTEDPKVADLARRIALRHAGVPVETMAMPYVPRCVDTAAGQAFILSEVDQRPVWTFYIHAARLALESTYEQAIDEAVGPGIEQPEAILFADPPQPLSPDDAWRKEAGLDGSTTEGI